MKTTILRVVVTVAALASIALARAGAVHAADPTPTPLIGGALDAKPSVVTLTSNSTMPVAVVVTTDGPFTLTPTTFSMDPGETVEMTVTGDPRGRIAAAMSVLDASVEGDTSSVVLEVAFPKPAPSSPPFGAIIGVLVLVLVVLRGLIAVRRIASRYTLVRKDGEGPSDPLR